MFCKEGVLGKFANLTGKHLWQGLFFNKVAGLRPVTSFKKRLWRKCFPVNIAKYLKTLFLTEHLWRSLLNIKSLTATSKSQTLSLKTLRCLELATSLQILLEN